MNKNKKLKTFHLSIFSFLLVLSGCSFSDKTSKVVDPSNGYKTFISYFKNINKQDFILKNSSFSEFYNYYTTPYRLPKDKNELNFDTSDFNPNNIYVYYFSLKNDVIKYKLTDFLYDGAIKEDYNKNIYFQSFKNNLVFPLDKTLFSCNLNLNISLKKPNNLRSSSMSFNDVTSFFKLKHNTLDPKFSFICTSWKDSNFSIEFPLDFNYNNYIINNWDPSCFDRNMVDYGIKDNVKQGLSLVTEPPKFTKAIWTGGPNPISIDNKSWKLFTIDKNSNLSIIDNVIHVKITRFVGNFTFLEIINAKPHGFLPKLSIYAMFDYLNPKQLDKNGNFCAVFSMIKSKI